MQQMYSPTQDQCKLSPFLDRDILVSNVGADLSNVANFLISKEQYILDNYPFVSDYGTMLPTNVTTRSSTYNVFHFMNECPDLQLILDHIKQQYNIYVKNVGFEEYVKKPGINCWFNILRKGEKIGIHKHSENERSFVCATLSIQVDETETFYRKHGEIVKSIPNRNGEFVMFKCDLEHGTTEHTKDSLRVTLGIDIFFDMDSSKKVPDFHKNLIEV